MKLHWQAAAATDRGLVRADNQDNYYISPDHRIMLVADGMGGLKGGAIASRLAVEAVEQFFWERIPDANDEISIQEWLAEAISLANQSVYTYASANPEVKKMGTTIVIAALSDRGLVHIAHLGDSRAYRVRGTDISVLTQDHSMAFELLLRGQLTPEQYERSPFRNHLTRCVGHNTAVTIDQSPATLEAGDWLLLCTDGLTGVVQESQIAKTLNEAKDPESACKQLIEQTLAGGAPDNVTVIGVRYSEKKARLKTTAETRR